MADPLSHTFARDADLRTLREALCAAGCFRPRPARAVLSAMLHVALAAAAFYGASALPWPLACLLFPIGSFFWYQLGWLMHDGAHGAVFERAGPNRVFTHVVAGLLGELPSGWQYGHNRHHASPNVRGLDGDQAERWDPTRRYGSAWRAALSLFLLVRVGRVWLPKTLLLLGLRDGFYAYRHRRDRFALELLLALGGHALQLWAAMSWFGAWGPLAYLLNTHLGMVYLNAVFAGNHYDLPAFDADPRPALEPASLQVLTAANYSGGAVARYVFGGLEHQVEHHLFPALPRHAFPRAAPIVRAYCAARGLPYRTRSFARALRAVVAFHLTPEPARPLP